jgi:CubicO group peptidase (beta-lactamase class C family)
MKQLMILIACLAISTSVFGQPYEKEYDRLMQEIFTSDGPGGAALVTRNDQIIYRKAFGKANMELDVDMVPENIFRIGSNTKQFTACAILKLRDEGKLELGDDITKYIEGFPTHGHTITIQHLLTHTSGIRSYTSMPEFTREVQKQDWTPMELIDFFKNQPMDFKPGEKYLYNNSAYSMLGYIIEVVSGKTYEEYIVENFFVPLEMNSSYYGSASRIINNRAAGYSKRDTLYINTPYLSMTQPYAAGALISTVDDMYQWYRAVMEDRVISDTSRQEAQSTYHLNDGRETGYGYGWAIGNIQGSPMISHSGGINGFLTHTLYLPEEKVFAAVFSNCDCNAPGEIGIKMAAIAIGKPFEWEKISVPDDILRSYEGVYESEHDGDRIITFSEGKLYSMRSGSARYEIFPYEKDKFFFEEGVSTLQFQRADDNAITAVISRGTGSDIEWKKTDRPVPELEEIELDESIRMKYVGKYELMPTFHISIFITDDIMYAQATGQDKVEIRPIEQNKFALVDVDAQLTFNMDEQGKVVSLTLYQNGEHEAKKIE